MHHSNGCRPTSSMEDTLFNVFMREGTIARYPKFIINKLPTGSRDDPLVHRAMGARYISMHFNKSVGPIMVFNPTHKDVCPKRKKCNTPNCSKLHQKIKYSLFTKLARFRCFENQSQGDLFYEWNHKNKKLLVFTCKDIDPRLLEVLRMKMDKKEKTLSNFRKHFNPKELPYFYAFFLFIFARKIKDFFTVKKYLEMGEKQLESPGEKSLLIKTLHGKDSYLFPPLRVFWSKLQVFWAIFDLAKKEKRYLKFCTKYWDLVFFENRKYTFYGHRVGICRINGLIRNMSLFIWKATSMDHMKFFSILPCQ